MKMELIAALLHKPQVLFLDEPTLGLDVVSQHRVRDFLRHLVAEEKITTILTSHYLQDIESLCKRVVIIDHGRIIHDGSWDQIVRDFSDCKEIVLRFSGSPPSFKAPIGVKSLLKMPSLFVFASPLRKRHRSVAALSICPASKIFESKPCPLKM